MYLKEQYPVPEFVVLSKQTSFRPVRLDGFPSWSKLLT